MIDKELQAVLDTYDPDELRLVVLDGYIIYKKVDNGEDEKLWSWDVEFDGEPYGALETLFKEVGLTVE